MNLKMLDLHAHPLEPKKRETKSRLVKPGHGMPNRDFPLKSHASKRSNRTKVALPKFKGTILLKALVASCVLISSVGAESAAPTSQPNGAICGDTDPSFCEAELTTFVEIWEKCGSDDINVSKVFYEKCEGTCGFCPAPPPSPPPPSPPCGDTDPGFCAAELTSPAELAIKCKEDLFYEKCKGSCFFCPAPPPSPPPPCGNTDPSFCEAELPTLAEKILKCGWATFEEKCKGTCGYCPGAGRPPPSPPPPPWSPPPSAPACSDKEGETCKKKKCDKYPLKKKRKCKKTCDLCGPLPPSSPPSPAAPPPETNCAGLADEKECTIKVKKCQKKPPKSMKKCQKNCKKDGKKKPPLCEKTCCELGF